MKTLSSYIHIPFLSTAMRNVVLVVLGSITVAVCAQISIPLSFSPVPITGQTFAVLLVGMILGTRMGACALALYLLEGSLGLPVFASGFSSLLGPSGGYLWGFCIAAGGVGFLAERGWDRSIVSTFFAMIIGNILLFIPGLLQLGFVLGWDKPILKLGLYPFIIGCLIKTTGAAVLLPHVWKIITKTRE